MTTRAALSLADLLGLEARGLDPLVGPALAAAYLGVSEAVRMAQAGWRSDDARLIYEGKGVSREKLKDAGAAMVRLVGGEK